MRCLGSACSKDDLVQRITRRQQLTGFKWLERCMAKTPAANRP
jgi:hypothetical protein